MVKKSAYTKGLGKP